MDIQKRLFRRPFTTILWAVLVTAMALLLCVGSALWYSSYSLMGTFDEIFTAAAVRTDRDITYMEIETEHGIAMKPISETKALTSEDVSFLEGLDSVEGVYFHSLTGGYSPVFSPVIGLNERVGRVEEPYYGANESYDEIMLIGTVSHVTRVSPSTVSADMSAYGLSAEEYGTGINVMFTIDEIVLGRPEFPFAEGGSVECSFYVYGIDATEYFQKGQRFLITQEPNLLNATPRLNSPSFSYPVGDTLQGRMYSVVDAVDRPQAAKLDGTLEAFLAEPENAVWVEYMESWDLANHSLPIIGTDCLESIYGFLSTEVTISNGRSFTQEEYDAGARVCILSETLANQIGVKVGDAIPISQFDCTSANQSIYQYSEDGKLNNPTIGEILPGVEFVTENEDFTVVGLYRQTNAWDDSSYSFSPNTVFIPKKAQIPGGFGDVTGEKERGSFGIYLSVLLKKGCMTEFNLALSETELAGEFMAMDQGYEAMIGSVESLQDSAAELLLLVCAGWVLLLALYVLLYQGTQRKAVGTMRSLGASVRQTKRYLFGSGVSLASASVLIGTVLSVGAMKIVSDQVTEQMLSTITTGKYSGGIMLDPQSLAGMIAGSQLPLPMLLALAAAQIGMIALVLWLHAGALCKKRPRDLMGV